MSWAKEVESELNGCWVFLFVVCRSVYGFDVFDRVCSRLRRCVYQVTAITSRNITATQRRAEQNTEEGREREQGFKPDTRLQYTRTMRSKVDKLTGVKRARRAQGLAREVDGTDVLLDVSLDAQTRYHDNYLGN